MPTEDDAVEGAFQRAVVLEQEADAVGQAALLGAAVGDGELLLGECDTGDVDAAVLGQIEAEAAPAGADVEGRAGRA